MEQKEYRQAVFGGGCFWCLEAVFLRLSGVIDVTPGYSGGTVSNPRYEDVCTGNTGHAEVVKIDYDPGIISYETLLDWFWRCHDPTQKDKQGNDIGTQYRSVIFYLDDDQKRASEASMSLAQQAWEKPIVTQIEPDPGFWEAESYHKRYFDKHPFNGYCQVVIRPKLHKLGI